MERHSWIRVGGQWTCRHCPVQRHFVGRDSLARKGKRIVVEHQRGGPDGEWSEERIACVEREAATPRRNRVVTLYGADATRAIEAYRAVWLTTQGASS